MFLTLVFGLGLTLGVQVQLAESEIFKPQESLMSYIGRTLKYKFNHSSLFLDDGPFNKDDSDESRVTPVPLTPSNYFPNPKLSFPIKPQTSSQGRGDWLDKRFRKPSVKPLPTAMFRHSTKVKLKVDPGITGRKAPFLKKSTTTFAPTAVLQIPAILKKQDVITSTVPSHPETDEFIDILKELPVPVTTMRGMMQNFCERICR